MRTRDSNKEELVKQKTIEMIVKYGIEGFAMNRLAKECGISVATLYIYYADKEDLIKKIGIEMGTFFFKSSLKDFTPDMPFAIGLAKQWENRSSFMMNNTDKLVCWEILQNSNYGDFIVNESLMELKEIMTKFLNGAIERKEIVPVSKEVFWSIAYGPLYNLLRFHEKGKGLGGTTPFKLTDDVQKEALRLVIKALTP
ncbi:TetR/AcrR family transcriptional regulator [Flavobacterium plurextorum]|uniref:TetR/AcrR family transcriptional regulator n=1 Tax=Flavobacterium TaxID=237 RepID=UPI000C61B1E7|nr:MULTISPECIES: TetR/AcrR family transcriptional regulator [Flavobacterium]PIF70808.1 TetR family transcriptional regulator [Flavobacterium sp. 2]UUW08012.1 TetR/AcrR family transcriptional regulator [Flavobacterium plurextorum]